MKKLALSFLSVLFIFVLTGCNIQDLFNKSSDEHTHSFGEWVRYTNDQTTPCDESLYYRICTECKDIEWQSGDYAKHSFDTETVAPSCTAQGYDQATCSICGFIEKSNYTDVVEHDYASEYSYNSTNHWIDCKNCEAKKNEGNHTLDNSGCCTICKVKIGTLGIIYQISSNGSYAEIVDYTGTATDIIISNEYNGVPVTKICSNAFNNCTSNP